MILIGGASETYRGGMSAFKEERQVLLAAPLCKFAHAIDSVKRIPYYVAEATRQPTYGRPGEEAMNFKGPALVNCLLSQGSARKPQQFRWHS